MSQAEWAQDFSYEYYERLLTTAAEHFDVAAVHDAAERGDSETPMLLLRHDVDLCPLRALPMARLEAKLGFRSTYFCMVRSPFYSLADPQYREAVRELADLGHEVGLHFELDRDASATELEFADLEALVKAQADDLVALTGAEVTSVSFHRPLARHVAGPTEVAGLTNAYAERWMRWYLSDSRGRWREGEPLPQLASGRGQVLQVLAHPIWWGGEHVPAAERLQEFFEEKTADLSDEDVQAFDEALSANISMPRSGRRPEKIRTIGGFDTDTEALRRRIDSHARYGKHDLNAWIFEHLDPQPGQRILDLGSGTGKQSVPLAEVVGPEGSVVALDASDRSLDILRKSVADAGLDLRVRTIRAYLHETETALADDDRFDRVVASYSLYYTQDIDGLARFLSSRLEPDGRFFFCGPSPQNNAELKALHAGVSGTEPQLVAAADFMVNSAPAACARYFRIVRSTSFENPLEFDSAEALVEYWRSHNLYDADLDEAFAAAADRHFDEHPTFRTVKRAVGVLAS